MVVRKGRGEYSTGNRGLSMWLRQRPALLPMHQKMQEIIRAVSINDMTPLEALHRPARLQNTLK